MRVFLIALLLITGCLNKQPRDVQLVRALTSEVAAKLKEEKGLLYIGRGSQMMHEIEMLAMSFVYKHEVDIDEGRTLLIAVLEEYMNAVNSSEEIRPYLANHPFVAKNIEIRIFIHNPDNSKVEEGKISVISAINGILKYKADEGNHYKMIYRETYEEALEKLTQSHRKEAA